MDSAPTHRPHIVFVIERPLDARDVDRLGIAFIVQRGTSVSVIDVGEMTLPYLDLDRSNYASFSDFDVHRVASQEELDRHIPLARSADLLFLNVGTSHFAPETMPIHRFVARSGTPYLVQFSNAYPGWNRYRGDTGARWSRARDVAKRWREIKPATSLLARLPRRWLGVRPASFLVVGGRRCHNYGSLVDRNTQVIHAHAMDYELFLRERERQHRPTESAVFIDEYLPYHTDLAMMGLDAPMAAEPYFAALRALFDKVEAERGLRVVIAACPRADYSDKPWAFGDRTVEYNATARLVAESNLVIAHRSTAINFAVLFRKPILLTATAETYRHSSQTPYFDGFAEALRKPIQFIDEVSEVDLATPFEIDDEVYDRYIEDFIKQPSSPEQPYWQIVTDAINASSQARV